MRVVQPSWSTAVIRPLSPETSWSRVSPADEAQVLLVRTGSIALAGTSQQVRSGQGLLLRPGEGVEYRPVDDVCAIAVLSLGETFVEPASWLVDASEEFAATEVESVAEMIRRVSSPTDEEPFETETAEVLVSRIQHRLLVVDALIWGVEHPDELVGLVRGARTREEAVALLADRYGFNEFRAHHLLDLPFSRLVADAKDRLHEERERLLRGEDTSSR